MKSLQQSGVRGKLWGFIGLDRIGRYNVYDGFLVETRNVKP